MNVYFLHIPKTAGSTVATILKENYDNYVLTHSYAEFNRSVEEWKDEKNVCLHGHFLFSQTPHTKMNKEGTYITILRDPVERVISEYYFMLQSSYHSLYETFKDATLEEYISSELPEIRMAIRNRQTTMLTTSGIANVDEAIQNLTEHFSIVGISEYFDESIELLGRELGLDSTEYITKNVTKNKGKRSDISSDTIERIKEMNQEDIKLYEWALENFKTSKEEPT